MSRDWLECGICLERFSAEGQSRPHVLLCGHSFCYADISTILSKDACEVLTCPVCHQQGGLQHYPERFPPKNYGMINFIQTSDFNKRKYQVGPADADGCFECGTCPASDFCLDCDAKFCIACIKVVHSHRSLSLHKIVPIASKPLPLLRCSTHGNKKMKLFCQTCLSPGCSLCASHGLHQGHTCSILESAAVEMRPSVESATAACKNQVKQLEAKCARMGQQEQDLILKKNEMLSKLREDLDLSWIAVAISSMHDTFSAKLCTAVDAQVQLLGKQRVESASCLAEAAAVLHEACLVVEADDGRLLSAFKGMTERLAACATASQTAIDSDVVSTALECPFGKVSQLFEKKR
jgi:hypothetical protein